MGRVGASVWRWGLGGLRGGSTGPVGLRRAVRVREGR